MKSVVLERRGEAVHFQPRLLELSAHYHFAVRPCRPGRGNEKAYASHCTPFAGARLIAFATK